MPEKPVPVDAPINLLLLLSEVERAHAIKNAVLADASLANLTDYQLVQWALVHPQTEMPEVLAHIRHMQAFVQEYRILDTLEDGVAAIDALTQQQPGAFLTIEFNPQEDNCVAINDFARYFPSRTRESDQHHAVFARGMYYRFQALHPNHFATRKGCFLLFECEGAGAANFDSEVHQRLIEELFQSYPKNEKDVFFVNSPTVVNVMVGLWKKYMTPQMLKAFHLGYQIPSMEHRRLSEIYYGPTPEEARQRVIRNTGDLLRVRYYNQERFRLPELSTAPPLRTMEELLSIRSVSAGALGFLD